MNKRKVITVDGLLATGKTALAKGLAEKLGYIYLSSGMLYRGIAHALISENLCNLIEPENNFQLSEFIKKLDLTLDLNINGEQILLINDKDVTRELFGLDVSQLTSKAAAIEEVRTALYPYQRNAFPNQNLVAEGRDMGSVVFQDADLKFYIEIDLEVKIERRFNQLYSGQNLSPDETKSLKLLLESECLERDRRDSERAIAPTVVPEGAILINNSHDPLTQVIQKMYDHAALAGLV